MDVSPRIFDISAYRPIFEISANRRPSRDLPTSFQYKNEKISILIYKLAHFDQIWRNFLKISTYRQPTDNLPRFVPNDNLQKTYRHLSEKKSKKISVLLYKILEVESIWKKSNMAKSPSSVDHQTHRGFDISKNIWCHKSVDLGEQPPEVWGDLDELFGLLLLLLLILLLILLLLLAIHFAIVAGVQTSATMIAAFFFLFAFLVLDLNNIDEVVQIASPLYWAINFQRVGSPHRHRRIAWGLP